MKQHAIILFRKGRSWILILAGPLVFLALTLYFLFQIYFDKQIFSYRVGNMEVSGSILRLGFPRIKLYREIRIDIGGKTVRIDSENPIAIETVDSHRHRLAAADIEISGTAATVAFEGDISLVCESSGGETALYIEAPRMLPIIKTVSMTVAEVPERGRNMHPAVRMVREEGGRLVFTLLEGSFPSGDLDSADSRYRFRETLAWIDPSPVDYPHDAYQRSVVRFLGGSDGTGAISPAVADSDMLSNIRGMVSSRDATLWDLDNFYPLVYDDRSLLAAVMEMAFEEYENADLSQKINRLYLLRCMELFQIGLINETLSRKIVYETSRLAKTFDSDHALSAFKFGFLLVNINESDFEYPDLKEEGYLLVNSLLYLQDRYGNFPERTRLYRYIAGESAVSEELVRSVLFPPGSDNP